MIAVGWLAATLVIALLGWATGTVLGTSDLERSVPYQLVAGLLLAIGLYGSTAGIHLRTAQRNLGAILFATTVGVSLKAALIMAAVYLVIDPRLTLIGLAVAQIDPLSVSAMIRRSNMSEQAKTILRSWASFDDPVTALLTVYAVLLFVAEPEGGTGTGTGGVFSYAGGLVANLLFVAAGLGVWALLRVLAGRAGDRQVGQRPADERPMGERPMGERSGNRRPAEERPAEERRYGKRWAGALWVVTLVVLAGLLAFAAANFLMLGVALLGLFFRPPGIDRVLGYALPAALLVATLALGLLLTDGIAPIAGLALGLFAFTAQIVAAAILPARLTRTDRTYLALGQQNGITAIILALALEPLLPGTVAVVAPAVLVVNTLHLVTNAWWDLPRRRPATRYGRRRTAGR